MNGAAAHCDVVVVGGGMVGASLALALAGNALRVALVEPVLPGVGVQPSFDERCTALANGSRQMLANLGAWPAIAPHAATIRTIHVSEAGRFGSTRIEASALGLPALGYTAPNRAIGAGLWEALRARPGVQLLAPARVHDATFHADHVELQLQQGGGTASREQRLRARLVVAADGDRSLVRERAGLGAAAVDYGQVALVATLVAERRAEHTAYERFGTAEGPLALLPRPDGHYTVVWCVAREVADELRDGDPALFLERLQAACGWRVGAFLKVGERAGYPLRLQRAQRLIGPRVVLVGNAAQSLHPVAGQGFNLGLRDVATLAETLVAAGLTGRDPGDPALLAQYQQARLQDRAGMTAFTDGLVRLFALSFPGAGALRSAGLTLFDVAPGAKRALSGVSWGFGARTPRLLRGLPSIAERE